MALSSNLTDALGNSWSQHEKEYFRIPPDGFGRVLKKVYDSSGKLVGAERVEAPEFMKWAPGTGGPVAVVAKNLRDFLQSSMAWGVPINELLYVAELLDHLGLYAIAKTGGGAMKQVADKSLEYGWDNLAKIAALTKNTPGEALGREDCIVSYDKCPPDLINAYYKLLSESGVHTNRAFTGSNQHADDRNAYAATLAAGMKVQGEITYPVAKMPTEWWVEQALRKVDRGATSIGIKDGTGRMAPQEAKEVVSALRKALPKNIRIVMHCQSTIGIAANTYQAGLEAGADAIHVVVGGWGAQRGAFPGLKSMMEILKGTDRESEYDQVRGITSKGKVVNIMEEVDLEMRRIIKKFPYLLSSNQAVEERAISQGAPGGGMAAYEVWLKEQTPPADGKFDAILDKQRETLAVMGQPASITPYYKIACDQASQNVSDNPHGMKLLRKETTWDKVPGEDKASGNWKNLTPQFRKLLKGGYGRMPADDMPELLTKEEANLRNSLKRRVLEEDIATAIFNLGPQVIIDKQGNKTTKEGTITKAQAEVLKQNAEKLLEVGKKINEAYEPTRRMVEAQDWVNDVEARLEKARETGVNVEHFEARLALAIKSLNTAQTALGHNPITQDEYVAFMKKGTLSDKMLKIVEVVAPSLIASSLEGPRFTAIAAIATTSDLSHQQSKALSSFAPDAKDLFFDPAILGKVIKEGTYIACAPADTLEPRMDKYREKVRTLIRSGTRIGDIRSESDIERRQDQFEKAVVYAAMYTKLDEGLHLLKAFELKEKMLDDGILPGSMADAALKQGKVQNDDPVHKVLKDYDRLKRKQVLEAPVKTKTEKRLQAEARLAAANDNATLAGDLACKLIKEIGVRERQEVIVETGLSETRIRSIINPFATELGKARLAEKKLLADKTTRPGDAGQSARDISEVTELQTEQRRIADETRKTLAQQHGLNPAQVEAVVRIFNDEAKAWMRKHGGRHGDNGNGTPPGRV